MSTMTTYHPAALRRPGATTRLIRRVAIGIQLGMLVLLLVGRAVSAIDDVQLAHGSAITPASAAFAPR